MAELMAELIPNSVLTHPFIKPDVIPASGGNPQAFYRIIVGALDRESPLRENRIWYNLTTG